MLFVMKMRTVHSLLFLGNVGHKLLFFCKVASCVCYIEPLNSYLVTWVPVGFIIYLLCVLHLFSWLTKRLTYHDNFSWCISSQPVPIFYSQYHMFKTRYMRLISYIKYKILWVENYALYIVSILYQNINIFNILFFNILVLTCH